MTGSSEKAGLSLEETSLSLSVNVVVIVASDGGSTMAPHGGSSLALSAGSAWAWVVSLLRPHWLGFTGLTGLASLAGDSPKLLLVRGPIFSFL